MLELVKDPNSAISDERLDEFERKWRLTLPLAYRAFLLKNNGGVPVPSVFPIHGMVGNPIGRIQAFLGLDTTIGAEDLNETIETVGGSLPHGVIPIAVTGGETTFVLIPIPKPHQ